MKVYKNRKTNELKLWQAQVNTSAWLQGQYIRAAVESMFPKGQPYPDKPFEVFKNVEVKSLTAEEEQKQNTLEDERAIRERSEQIDKMLANKNLQPGLIIGEKRI